MLVSLGRRREENERKEFRERVKPNRRRLLAEQTVAVVVLGCGKKVDAMWHTPHRPCLFPVCG